MQNRRLPRDEFQKMSELTKEAGKLTRSDPQTAWHLIKEAESFDPDNSYVLGTKVRILLRLKRHDDAERVAVRFVQLHKDEFAYNHLAMALLANRNFDQADQAIKTSLQINPDSPIARGLFEKIQAAKGDPIFRVKELNRLAYKLLKSSARKALEVIEEAEELCPQDQYTLSIKAKILCRLRRLEEATEVAQKNVKLNPDAVTYSQLAFILLRRNKLHEAEKAAKNSLEFGQSERNQALLAEIQKAKENTKERGRRIVADWEKFQNQ